MKNQCHGYVTKGWSRRKRHCKKPSFYHLAFLACLLVGRSSSRGEAERFALQCPRCTFNSSLYLQAKEDLGAAFFSMESVSLASGRVPSWDRNVVWSLLRMVRSSLLFCCFWRLGARLTTLIWAFASNVACLSAPRDREDFSREGSCC